MYADALASGRPSAITVRSAVARAYQACEVPQCGQPTEVVTGALNTKPQEQL